MSYISSKLRSFTDDSGFIPVASSSPTHECSAKQEQRSSNKTNEISAAHRGSAIRPDCFRLQGSTTTSGTTHSLQNSENEGKQTTNNTFTKTLGKPVHKVALESCNNDNENTNYMRFSGMASSATVYEANCCSVPKLDLNLDAASLDCMKT